MSETLQACQDAQRQQVENAFFTLQEQLSEKDLRDDTPVA